jgi:hypothetical protein
MRRRRWTFAAGGLLTAAVWLALFAGSACSQSPAASGLGRQIVATSFAGVDPSGKTDSTTGLSNALVSAAGSELQLPAGTYLVSAFNIPANTRVIGAGQGATTLKRLPTATRSDASTLVQLASGDDLESVTVDLDSPAYGNVISGVGPVGGVSTTGVAVRHVAIRDAGFFGLSLNDAGGATHAGAQVDDVTVTNSAWVGANLRGIKQGSATRVSVSSTGYDAVDLESDTDFVLSSFTIDRSTSPKVIPAESNNSTTSTTSTRIARPGASVFTVASCAKMAAGQAVYAYAAAAPANYLYGTVSSCSGATLTITVTAINGAGTFASWNIVGETGMLLWRGVKNANIVIRDGSANDNRHALSDGVGIGENGTSSQARLTPGTGTVAFTVPSGACAGYGAGQEVTAIDRAAPTVNYMRGAVASCSGTTLTASMTVAAGSGSHADWLVNTEPGAELISNVTVTKAGLFGIDLASNTKLVHAVIVSPAQRGLEIGLDLGGRLSGASASDVRIRNIRSGPGVFLGNGRAFQSFENIALSGIVVQDDQPSMTTTYGVEVNATPAQQAFSNVTLDTSSSHYSQVLTGPYVAFGGPDPVRRQ